MAHGAMKHEDFLVMLENYITERNPVGEYLEMLRKEEAVIDGISKTDHE